MTVIEIHEIPSKVIGQLSEGSKTSIERLLQHKSEHPDLSVIHIIQHLNCEIKRPYCLRV